MDGWMDDLQFYILLNSIWVISEKWESNNEILSATEPCIGLERPKPQHRQCYINKPELKLAS